MDAATISVIADTLDEEAAARIREADDARNGTGSFAHLVGLPMVDGEIDLAGICQVNLIVANSFAELAKKLRALP